MFKETVTPTTFEFNFNTKTITVKYVDGTSLSADHTFMDDLESKERFIEILKLLSVMHTMATLADSLKQTLIMAVDAFPVTVRRQGAMDVIMSFLSENLIDEMNGELFNG